MARRNPFSSQAGSPYIKARREVNATIISKPPPLMARSAIRSRECRVPPVFWLAPQSDHGSAARAETEAFFHYGPQSFFEPSWLALPKARAREVGATMMTGRKFLRPPLLWLAIRSREPREAFFQHGPLQCFFEFNSTGSFALQKARAREVRATTDALQKARVREVGARMMTGRKLLRPPPLGARSAIRSRECRARGN